MSAGPRILIAGGGTGGHVLPALATAAALRDHNPEVEVEFVGTATGLEAQLVPGAGWPLHVVRARAFHRALSLSSLAAPAALGLAARHALRVLNGPPRAAAAVVFGGYTSAPLALAAGVARVPLVVHEQNAVPGLANRLAARWAARVAVSYPDSAGRLGRPGRTVVTGNPVRPELAGAPRAALRAEALAAFELDPDRRTLLVFGGSQGARRINEAIVDAAGRWSRPERLQILHAAGRGAYDELRARWRAELGPQPALAVRCEAFVERMDLAYAAADAAVSRSGASTIAELTVMGVPSVLVPYPYATADHQMANARALAEAGGAVVVPDADLDGRRLVGAVQRVLFDEEAHSSAAAAALAFGRPDAARRLAQVVLEAAAGRAARRAGRLGALT